MKTKVSVDRIKLLKLVEGRMRKAENEYKRASAAYPKQVASWEAGCISKLESALTSAKKGRIPTDRYGNPQVTFTDRPTKPSEGRELCNLRRMVATLKIGADEKILLSQEDADYYFGECRL